MDRIIFPSSIPTNTYTLEENIQWVNANLNSNIPQMLAIKHALLIPTGVPPVNKFIPKHTILNLITNYFIDVVVGSTWNRYIIP